MDQRKLMLKEPVVANDQQPIRNLKLNEYDKAINNRCLYRPNSTHTTNDCYVMWKYLEELGKSLSGVAGSSKNKPVEKKEYPLVLALVIKNIKLKQVLIDGDNALNILFAKMLDDIKIPSCEITQSIEGKIGQEKIHEKLTLQPDEDNVSAKKTAKIITSDKMQIPLNLANPTKTALIGHSIRF
uniref:Uncharacterized protein n=1 Tax=Oryza brachyantha TaxID=4533 RepID=J3KUF1_ORYBR